MLKRMLGAIGRQCSYLVRSRGAQERSSRIADDAAFIKAAGLSPFVDDKYIVDSSRWVKAHSRKLCKNHGEFVSTHLGISQSTKDFRGACRPRTFFCIVLRTGSYAGGGYESIIYSRELPGLWNRPAMLFAGGVVLVKHDDAMFYQDSIAIANYHPCIGGKNMQYVPDIGTGNGILNHLEAHGFRPISVLPGNLDQVKE